MPDFVSTLTTVTYQNYNDIKFYRYNITTHLKAAVELTYKKRYVLYSKGGRKVILYIFSETIIANIMK